MVVISLKEKNDTAEWLSRISDHWRKIWESERLYEAEPIPSKPKFYLTAAFMYPNGPAHVGHARTYVIPDIIARYKRGLGYNVLFPMGFHYTGTPILATAERIASRDESYIKSLSENFGVPKALIAKLDTPLKLAKFFHNLSKQAMKEYGLSIDWRREFTTIDPEFKSFIRWQFTKLKEKGYLIRGSHPVGWCPKHNMPVGMHDTKGDVEPEIGELVVVKFVGKENVIYPAATLRPETVLGVTNIWVNPKEDYCLSVVKDGDKAERWLLACASAEKLKFQREVKIVKRIKGKELLKTKAINPILGNEIKVLGASFVNPKFGTGIVMSVPAHAPYDYVALRDLLGASDPERWREFKPIPLIKVKGYGKYPAKEEAERLNIKSQEEKELLDKATKNVYRIEYSKGLMLTSLSHYICKEIISGAKDFISLSIEGKPVRIARDAMKNFLLEKGYATTIYEILNAPVYCRCGTEIVVKVVKDQWFINYGDPRWKEEALKALSSMRIIPEEARSQFLATIEWLKAKACARSRGLGTELPWAEGWVIESLSDSTIYMAFYTVIHKIRKYGISADRLTNEFWDYVMLGKGNVKELESKLSIESRALKEIREEFNYWYPLNSRHSGKDLIPSHLTFFIFNHVAIFPEDKWPKQIVANGWVLIKGEKMSKSLGNIKTLHGLVKTYSPDAVRLALSLEAEVEADLNLNLDNIGKIYERFRRIKELVNRLTSENLTAEYSIPEKWLISKVARHLLSAYEKLDKVRIRGAGIEIFYLIPQEIERYLEIVNIPSSKVSKIVEPWLKVLSAYTPYFAEEMWHKIGRKSLIVKESWASAEELRALIDFHSEIAVDYVIRFIEDIKSVLQVVKGNRAIIYVAPQEEYKHLIRVKKILDNGGKIGDVIKYVANNFSRIPKKHIPGTGKALLNLVSSLEPYVIEVLQRIKGIDEAEAINNMKEYVERKTGVKIENVYVCTDKSAPDLGDKKQMALPWRPSIYLFNKLMK